MNERQHLARQRFGTHAQNYVESPVHSTGYTLERLVDLVNPGPGKRALDIATGGGHVALALARRGAAVIASDLTPQMLQTARNFIQGQGISAAYLCVDGQHLPFADKSLDIITCRLAPHHFPDVPQYVQECARTVRPGGVVGLVDHAGAAQPAVARYVNAYERVRDPSHVWEYSQAEWEALFADSGLHVAHSEVARTRLDFGWWNRMQNNDGETILRLRVMLQQAPQAVADWLEPEFSEDGSASFTRWQLILIGIKVG
jgi:2-polyprenyl-3-methyl-5-hydroxy-6-metoxy-1,4-benzoquinol methylase